MLCHCALQLGFNGICHQGKAKVGGMTAVYGVIPAIPLAVKTEQRISICLKILETALPAAQEKWGIEPIKHRNDEWIAELSLPEDIALQTVFSFGAGVEILSPSTLRKKAYALASELAKKYE